MPAALAFGRAIHTALSSFYIDVRERQAFSLADLLGAFSEAWTNAAEEHEIGYGKDEVPVLFGHYWFVGVAKPEANNVACLDYSVPRATGKLVAYRWSGEWELLTKHFVSVGNMTGPYSR